MRELLIVLRECCGTPPVEAERYRGRYWIKVRELSGETAHELIDVLRSYDGHIALKNNTGKIVVVRPVRL